MNAEPLLSEGHGDRWVVTYANEQAAAAGIAGRFPFPPGAVLVKESFQGDAGRPGAKGPVYVMEKRPAGYDRANHDWHYAVLSPEGKVLMSGSGRSELQTHMCAECHERARVNDYVFGTGTALKVTPIEPPPPSQPCRPR